MIVAALLAVLVQPIEPPAPPVMVPPPMVRMSPPPIITTPVIAMAPRPSEPPISVEVRVTAGERVLFADQMRVDSMVGASYSQSRTEAAARVCPSFDRYERNENNNFNLRLNTRSGEAGKRLLAVSVTWTRPVNASDCGATGSRTAGLNQLVTIEPGKAFTLTGDGALKVELSVR